MVRSIVEALAEYAKVQPDKLFLADGKVELTYLDAWKCVYGYAVHLRELGIRRGDHVVVRNSQNAQLVISQLAIQLVGAVFVPIEKNAADDRIAEIIGAVEAKLYLAAKQGEFSCKWETIKDVLSYKMEAKTTRTEATSPVAGSPCRSHACHISGRTGWRFAVGAGCFPQTGRLAAKRR